MNIYTWMQNTVKARKFFFSLYFIHFYCNSELVNLDFRSNESFCLNRSQFKRFSIVYRVHRMMSVCAHCMHHPFENHTNHNIYCYGKQKCRLCMLYTRVLICRVVCQKISGSQTFEQMQLWFIGKAWSLVEILWMNLCALCVCTVHFVKKNTLHSNACVHSPKIHGELSEF